MTSPAEPANPSGAIAALTGIRGFAALWVVFYHLRPIWNATYPEWTDCLAIARRGYLGVDLFALLSGFVISYTYASTLRNFSARSSARYLWLRFARIYPLHIAILALFLLARNRFSVSGIAALLSQDMTFTRQVLLLNGWGFESEFAWNAPSWTLSSEWLCYLCFPLLAPLTSRLTDGRIALGLAAASLTGTAVLLWLVGHAAFDAYLDWGWLRIGGEFIAGCWLFVAYRSGIAGGWPLGWLGLAALLVGLKLCTTAVPAGSVAAFAIVVFALAHSRQPLDLLFGNRVSVYLGEISFSIYMIHWFIIENSALLKLNTIALDIRGWIAIGAVLLAAAFLYEFVERPSRVFLRKLGLVMFGSATTETPRRS